MRSESSMTTSAPLYAPSESAMMALLAAVSCFVISVSSGKVIYKLESS